MSNGDRTLFVASRKAGVNWGKMDPKPRPNHRIYLQTLRRMTPEQRLIKAFELSETVRLLFSQGLRKRFPDLSPPELQKLYRERLDLCHNRNY